MAEVELWTALISAGAGLAGAAVGAVGGYLGSTKAERLRHKTSVSDELVPAARNVAEEVWHNMFGLSRLSSQLKAGSPWLEASEARTVWDRERAALARGTTGPDWSAICEAYGALSVLYGKAEGEFEGDREAAMSWLDEEYAEAHQKIQEGYSTLRMLGGLEERQLSRAWTPGHRSV